MAKSNATPNPEKEQPEKERTTVYMRRDLYKKLKYVCFKDETSQTDVVADALSDYFIKWEKENGEIKI